MVRVTAIITPVRILSMMAGILRRRIALLMIGLLAFAQGSVAFAACSMERGTVAPAMAMASDEPCAECGTSNLCAAHCTADLQLAGVAVSIVRGPADLPVLRIARPAIGPAPHTGLHAPPPGAPPRRILLHSFLI
jgi:hypothetical protein